MYLSAPIMVWILPVFGVWTLMEPWYLEQCLALNKYLWRKAEEILLVICYFTLMLPLGSSWSTIARDAWFWAGWHGLLVLTHDKSSVNTEGKKEEWEEGYSQLQAGWHQSICLGDNFRKTAKYCEWTCSYTLNIKYVKCSLHFGQMHFLKISIALLYLLWMVGLQLSLWLYKHFGFW